MEGLKSSEPLVPLDVSDGFVHLTMVGPGIGGKNLVCFLLFHAIAATNRGSNLLFLLNIVFTCPWEEANTLMSKPLNPNERSGPSDSSTSTNPDTCCGHNESEDKHHAAFPE